MRTTARRPPGPMCWSGNVPGRVWTRQRMARAPPESVEALGFCSYPPAYPPPEHHSPSRQPLQGCQRLRHHRPGLCHQALPNCQSLSGYQHGKCHQICRRGCQSHAPHRCALYRCLGPCRHLAPYRSCAPQACATAQHGAAQVHAATRTTERPPPHLHGPSNAARLGAPIPDTMRTPTPRHCAQARKPVAQGAVGIPPCIADTAPHPGHRIRHIPGETERKTQPSRRIVQTHRQTTRALARLGTRLHAEQHAEPHAGEYAEQRAQHGTKPVSANESAGDSD